MFKIKKSSRNTKVKTENYKVIKYFEVEIDVNDYHQ